MLSLKEIVNLKTALPVIPEIVSLLISELNHDEPNFLKIENLISNDPIITARLIKLANSAFFSFSKKIDTISDALNFLGYRKTLDLIIIAKIVSSFSNIKNIDMNAFWEYSLNVAKLTSTLAQNVKLDKQTAFTIGLTHAIGELVLHSGLPEQIIIINSKVNQFHPIRCSLEKDAFGYAYTDIAVVFAKKWKFSNIIVSTLNQQCHSINSIDYRHTDFEPMGIILYLAVWRCRAREANYNNKDLINNFPNEVSSLLNIDIDEVLQQKPIEWTTKSEVALLI